MSPFSSLCFIFVVLAALVQLSRGQETTKQPFLLQKIKDSLGIVHESIHQAIEKSKLRDIIIFDAPPTSTTTEMSIETTTGEDSDYELSVRQFIDVPVRCRPGYDFIRGNCHKKVLRWIFHFFLYFFLFFLVFTYFYLHFSLCYLPSMFPINLTFTATWGFLFNASVSCILKILYIVPFSSFFFFFFYIDKNLKNFLYR